MVFPMSNTIESLFLASKLFLACVMIETSWSVIVHFSAKLVDNALATGKIFEGEGFNYIKECFANGTLHLIGLLSDGGVHSRLDQLQVIIWGWSCFSFMCIQLILSNELFLYSCCLKELVSEALKESESIFLPMAVMFWTVQVWGLLKPLKMILQNCGRRALMLR